MTFLVKKYFSHLKSSSGHQTNFQDLLWKLIEFIIVVR